MEANRLLAKRAQESTERIEEMTKQMNQVAIKTKDETVSMKIITLVTLFYLPGTFISVCVSLFFFSPHPLLSCINILNALHCFILTLDYNFMVLFLADTSTQTVMSTDIISFPSDSGGFQWSALSVWLEATLPLMFLTFVAWGVVYRGVGKGWFTRKS